MTDLSVIELGQIQTHRYCLAQSPSAIIGAYSGARLAATPWSSNSNAVTTDGFSLTSLVLGDAYRRVTYSKIANPRPYRSPQTDEKQQSPAARVYVRVGSLGLA